MLPSPVLPPSSRCLLSLAPQVDIWGVGVLAFMLLSLQAPFPLQATPETHALVCSAQYSFVPSATWLAVSPHASAFIRACLLVEPSQRPGATGLVQHAWTSSVPVMQQMPPPGPSAMQDMDRSAPPTAPTLCTLPPYSAAPMGTLLLSC